jgi:hypothetical protein
MKRILDSQGGAFGKDATKPALKTVWFLVDPLFGFIFCVEYLFYLQIVSMLHLGARDTAKKKDISFFLLLRNGLLLSAIGALDSGLAVLVEHKALFKSPGCLQCFADLNRFA